MPRGCLISLYVQYLLYLLPLPSPKYCTVRTYLGPCQKGILFMPKASFSILRSESVQIKPLQWLPAVCTCHMSYCITPKGGQHIRPTLLPRHMLHLILINFADNFVYLCFFRLKSAFEQFESRSQLGNVPSISVITRQNYSIGQEFKSLFSGIISPANLWR